MAVAGRTLGIVSDVSLWFRRLFRVTRCFHDGSLPFLTRERNTILPALIAKRLEDARRRDDPFIIWRHHVRQEGDVYLAGKF